MFFIWVIVAGLLQGTVLKDLNLFAILAVYAGLRKGPLVGILIGGAIGMFVEIFSSSQFGLNLGLCSMLAFFSGLVKGHIFYKESVFTDFLFSFFGVILFYFMYSILTASHPASFIITALFSAVLSPLIFRMLDCSSSEV